MTLELPDGGDDWYHDWCQELFEALENGDVQALATLIEKHGKKLDYFRWSRYGPRNNSIFKELVKYFDGENLNMNSFENLCKIALTNGCVIDYNLLDWCVEFGAQELIPIILKLEDFPKKLLPSDTVIDIICSFEEDKKALEMIQYFVETIGIDLKTIRSTEDGSTLLHVACEYGDYNMVKYLVEIIGIDMNQPRNDHVLPIALITDSKKITDFLLKKGAVINMSGSKLNQRQFSKIFTRMKGSIDLSGINSMIKRMKSFFSKKGSDTKFSNLKYIDETSH